MRTKLIWAAIGLSIAALMAWAFKPTPMEVETAAVTQARFERAVQESGRTRVQERFVVSTPQSGRLARVLLKQGDAIKQGDTLGTLWPVTPALLDNRAQEQQAAAVRTAQAVLARSQAYTAHAAAALAQAKAELTRNNSLLNQQFVSATQHENAKLSVQLRDQELQAARQDEVAALHTLEQARIGRQHFSGAAAGRPGAGYAIKAPIAGKVLKIFQQSEGVVPAGTPLLELGDATKLEVVVDILTEEATQIRPGAAVQLLNWGGAGQLAGKVRLIEPAAFTKISALGVEEQRVDTIVDLTSESGQWESLGDGFKVDVRIMVEVVDDAVQVPVSALFPIGTQSGIFTVDKGYARLKKIGVKARNGVSAWVDSTLPVGSLVVVYPDSKLKDGNRVNVR